MAKIKVMTIFGTRPEAIKMAPVVKELKSRPDLIETVVAVTAQHREMLDQVLDLFSIKPEYDLNVMKESQSLAAIVAGCMNGLDELLVKEKPDVVLVHGDTTTTFVGSLASFYRGITVGHVEAGLRTDDKKNPFPEEVNRRLTGVLADLHFAPTKKQIENLVSERISRKNIFVTGNTVIDALLDVASRDRDPDYNLPVDEDLTKKRFLLVTAHRRENWGKPMESICMSIKRILDRQKDVEIVFPVHKNPVVRKTVGDILGGLPRVHLIEPVDYEFMVNLMKKSYFILTDSGGIQEEAPSLNKPVLVMRSVTERPEGIETGALKLVGTSEESVYENTIELLNDDNLYEKMASAPNPYGDGKAARRIVDALLFVSGNSNSRPDDFQIKL